MSTCTHKTSRAKCLVGARALVRAARRHVIQNPPTQQGPMWRRVGQETAGDVYDAYGRLVPPDTAETWSRAGAERNVPEQEPEAA